MKNLLKLQLRNLFRSRMFYVCAGLLFLMLVGFSFAMSVTAADKSAYMYMPQLMSLVGVDVIGVIFITLFVCMDSTEGTTKNIIARGFTRTQVLLAKYLVSIVGVFAMYGAIALLMVPMFLPNGLGWQSDMGLQLVAGVIGMVAEVVLFATVASIIEKNGGAIVANVVGPTMVPLGLMLIDGKLNTNLGGHWLMSLGSELSEHTDMKTFTAVVLQYAIYIVVCVVIGKLVVQKREVK